MKTTERSARDFLWDSPGGQAIAEHFSAQLVRGKSLRDVTRKTRKDARRPKVLCGEGVFEVWESGRIDGSIHTDNGHKFFERGSVRRSEEGDVQSGPLVEWEPAIEQVDESIRFAAESSGPCEAIKTFGKIWRRLEHTNHVLVTHTRHVWTQVDPHDQLTMLAVIPASLRDPACLQDSRALAARIEDRAETDAGAYPWLDEAIRLEGAGQGEESLDIIFDTLDDWLLGGRFAECSDFLGDVNVDTLTTAQLLTMLTATWHARMKMPNWGGFFDSVRRLLERRGEDADALLAGFEG